MIDMRDLYWRYRQVSGKPYNHNTHRLYYKFLGLEEGSHLSNGGYWVNKLGEKKEFTEETVRKMEWLSGPHYRAMYAVWRARNGEG